MGSGHMTAAAEGAFGNIFVRNHRWQPKGTVTQSHKHAFDHVTQIFEGAYLIEVQAEVNGAPGETIRSVTLVRGDEVLILAQTWHRLTALEDNGWYKCLYAHRDPQGQVVQRYTGFEAAYG